MNGIENLDFFILLYELPTQSEFASAILCHGHLRHTFDRFRREGYISRWERPFKAVRSPPVPKSSPLRLTKDPAKSKMVFLALAWVMSNIREAVSAVGPFVRERRSASLSP